MHQEPAQPIGDRFGERNGSVATVGIRFGAISEASSPYPLEFLTLPFLLWFALRFSERALTTGILLLAAIVSVSVGNHGDGTLMRRMLQKMGFEVVEAEDGTRGLEMFCEQKHEIRACILDLTMPGMDGLKLLSRIREVSVHAPTLNS